MLFCSGAGLIAWGCFGNNFSFSLSKTDRNPSCDGKNCSLLVTNFPEVLGRKRFFVELEQDPRYTSLVSTREAFTEEACSEFSKAGDAIKHAARFNYSFTTSEETALKANLETLPCGPLFAMYFMLERQFSVRKTSLNSTELKPELIQSFVPLPASSSFSGFFSSWSNMVSASTKSQFFIGYIDDVLPKSFLVEYRQGADVGLKTYLNIIVEDEMRKAIGGICLAAGVMALALGGSVFWLYSKPRKFAF